MRHEIIPNLRYADAPAAIEFLCKAFGFEKKVVYTDDKDPTNVVHGELLWQDRMVMVYSNNDTAFSRAAKMQTVKDVGGPTMGLYLTVEDVDGHARKAQLAGAKIIMEPEDKDYGGRGYSCEDPEGHVWSFGSFDPWAE